MINNVDTSEANEIIGNVGTPVSNEGIGDIDTSVSNEEVGDTNTPEPNDNTFKREKIKLLNGKDGLQKQVRNIELEKGELKKRIDNDGREIEKLRQEKKMLILRKLEKELKTANDECEKCTAELKISNEALQEIIESLSPSPLFAGSPKSTRTEKEILEKIEENTAVSAENTTVVKEYINSLKEHMHDKEYLKQYMQRTIQCRTNQKPNMYRDMLRALIDANHPDEKYRHWAKWCSGSSYIDIAKSEHPDWEEQYGREKAQELWESEANTIRMQIQRFETKLEKDEKKTLTG